MTRASCQNREPEQLTLFGGRQINGPSVARLESGHTLFVSTTGWLRKIHMDDFKVRAACRHLAFKQRRQWKERDADGDFLEWVLEWKAGRDGKRRAFHVRGPDGENLKRKVSKEKYHTPEYVRVYDPPSDTAFPSHTFATDRDDGYWCTGDDGTTWEIGSRGNDLDVLRQEVINHPMFWPEEKDALLRWLDGPRKLDADVAIFVDSYFVHRIQDGLPVTEEEVRASGLPDETVENLVYNLKNYRRFPPDYATGAS